MPELRGEIGQLWYSVNREVHDRLRQAFRESDIPIMGLILLRTIDHCPGVTVGELARRSGTVKSHVSKTVERLARQGYVDRRPDPDDQRLVRLFLTKASADIMGDMEARAKVVWSGITAGMEPEQLAEVTRGLRILLQALESTKEKVDM